MKHSPTEAHVQTLREHLRGHPLEAMITLAMITGMRRDELRYVTWSEIDMERREMHVLNGKTKNGSRLVHLPEACAQVLRHHHLRQMEQRSQTTSTKSHLDLVFPDGTGGILSRRLFVEQWQELLTEAGVPHLCFHDLRVLLWRQMLHEHRHVAHEEQDGE
jgi:integrase